MAVGMKNAAPSAPGSMRRCTPWNSANNKSAAPQMLNIHSAATVQTRCLVKPTSAMMARTPASRSPYPAATANAGGSDGETTPGIRKLSPLNLKNRCGITSAVNARRWSIVWSQGQTANSAAIAELTKLKRGTDPEESKGHFDPASGQMAP